MADCDDDTVGCTPVIVSIVSIVVICTERFSFFLEVSVNLEKKSIREKFRNFSLKSIRKEHIRDGYDDTMTVIPPCAIKSVDLRSMHIDDEEIYEPGADEESHDVNETHRFAVGQVVLNKRAAPVKVVALLRRNRYKVQYCAYSQETLEICYDSELMGLENTGRRKRAKKKN